MVYSIGGLIFRSQDLKPEPEERELRLSHYDEGETEERILIWWRRGRVELPVQKKDTQVRYRLIRPFGSCPGNLDRRSFPGPADGLWRPLSASGPPHPDISAPLPHPSGG